MAIFAAYAALLLYAHGRVPPGLNNDVAEEALRGIYLVGGHHLEVITFAVGFSAETLYLYLIPGSGAFRPRWDATEALFITSRTYFWRSEPYLTFG
jgi:hypothetical protein